MKKMGKIFVILAVILIFTPLFAPRCSSSFQTGSSTYLPFSVRPSEPFTFISWSDTALGTDSLAILSEQARQLDPDFTIFPGDLEPSGYADAEMAAWKNAMNGDETGKTSNDMLDITLPVRGNHDHHIDPEYDDADTAGWRSAFNLPDVANRVGAYNYSSQSEDINYSFEFANAVFVGLDVLGPITQIQPETVTFLDQALTSAEQRGLTHAFLYFHGPLYPVSQYDTCNKRSCPAPEQITGLIEVLNKHPIVSAVFSGHEHVHAYAHIDSSRMPDITHPFEEFITASTGSGYDTCAKTYRFEFCDAYHGFWTIHVDGNEFTASIYQEGTTTPMQTFSFTKE